MPLGYYLIEVEGSNLGLPDGTPGFIANRFVASTSIASASAKAVRLTERTWLQKWVPPGSPTPTLKVERAVQVNLREWIAGRQQNSGHIFYSSED